MVERELYLLISRSTGDPLEAQASENQLEPICKVKL
jgi:hypothetical protein